MLTWTMYSPYICKGLLVGMAPTLIVLSLQVSSL